MHSLRMTMKKMKMAFSENKVIFIIMTTTVTKLPEFSLTKQNLKLLENTAV